MPSVNIRWFVTGRAWAERYTRTMAAGAASDTTVSYRPVRLSTGRLGAIVLGTIVLACLVTLPWSLQGYRTPVLESGVSPVRPPSLAEPMGSDQLGRSLLWRCLLGGAISLGIGAAAASISVVIGVTWGAVAGYLGGRVDAAMMRIVDILYGLPYILLVVLLDLALGPYMERMLRAVFLLGANLQQATDWAASAADVVTLLVAIGSVSWLTLSRVIRGQVLSLRQQPFIEAARAYGVGPWRTFRYHLLPNLVGPIVVYTTLTVPQAILQESFLSFLGIGVQEPLPSWGRLASDGTAFMHTIGRGNAPWWIMLWPCLLLGATLLSLNFIGESLRDRFDPRSLRR